jgi:REP element-mobilizing transposase RayT
LRNIEPLSYGSFYHIYNRGIDSCDLFHDNDNYEYFLGLYDQYISPVADTFAWVLMKNHFHVLVKIKGEEEIGFIPVKTASNKLTRSGCKTAERVETFVTPSMVTNPDGGLIPKKYKPSNQFSHLFNAYAQAINKRYNRTGSLFDHPFKRKLIDNKDYLRQVILYIHNNPVHHGFCGHPLEYPWTSYLTCITSKPTKLQRDKVIDIFVSDANFKQMHDREINFDPLENWLGI